MKDIMLVLIFVLIGVVGFLIMKKMDHFLASDWIKPEPQFAAKEPEPIVAKVGYADERKRTEEQKEHVLNFPDVAKSVGMLLISTLSGYGFWLLGMSEANIIMMYILGVLFISVITNHQMYSIVASGISVIVFNFLFTEPRYTLFAYDKDYPVTFVTMFIAAFLTGSLADQLKKKTAQAAQAAVVAQKEQLRANLLRSISHDLRTPLTSISGNASNLISNEEKFDTDTKKQLYEDIYDDSMWLINLVENLLSVTKIEDGTVDIRSQAELLDEVITEALHHIDRKKEEHKITYVPSDEFILIKADARMIMQVVINLVDNAIKYTQKESEIVISTGKQGNQAIVRIADNGPGISDEMKPYVFDTFYSGAKNVADSRRSLGLGLALCKSIIHAHGGEIELTDNIPHGAVFTFSLPVEEVELHE